MYVVQSADDLSFLSSIEFVWCMGKKKCAAARVGAPVAKTYFVAP
jgi:hypothetical protein